MSLEEPSPEVVRAVEGAVAWFESARLKGIRVDVVKDVKSPTGKNKVVEVEYLNLLTDEGHRSIPLAQVGRIKLLNERLDAELRQALEALAGGHDTQKKEVALRFE